MTRVRHGLPDNVLGFEAVGKVTVFGEELEGWTFGATWQDAKLGGFELRKREKIAVVTDTDWVRHAVRGSAG